MHDSTKFSMKWKKNQFGGRKVVGKATMPIGHEKWLPALPYRLQFNFAVFFFQTFGLDVLCIVRLLQLPACELWRNNTNTNSLHLIMMKFIRHSGSIIQYNATQYSVSQQRFKKKLNILYNQSYKSVTEVLLKLVKKTYLISPAVSYTRAGSSYLDMSR